MLHKAKSMFAAFQALQDASDRLEGRDQELATDRNGGVGHLL
jgi:hypothetical protein